jgi:hypothetical protein
MLNVIVPNVTMLIIANNPFVLSVIWLNVIALSVVAPLKLLKDQLSNVLA